ncbi:MAG: hypothetical protein CSA03_00470 [Bacteroidetes bacterium]|nr:MAG: hypothetical protein CSA03_00470 [Bacteroidota bacterium]
MIQKQVILLFLQFVLVSSLGRTQAFSYQDFHNEKDSVLLVKKGLEAWSYYIRNSVDSLKIVGSEMVDSKYVSLYPVGLINLGSFHIRTNDIPKGIELLEEARELFAKERSAALLSETENEIGNAYFLKGNYNLSSRYYFSSMVHGANIADVTASYNGMIGFGKTICATGDTIRGVRFVREYLERCLKNDKFESASDACGFLGMIEGLKGKVELMSAYYRRGNVYAWRSNSKTHWANAHTNKAIDFFTKQKVDSAEMLFQKALSIRKEVGATRPIVEGYYNLAILNIETGRFDEAHKYALLGEELSKDAGVISWQLDCLLLLKEIAENQRRFHDIEPIQVEIDLLQAELELMGNLDSEILDLAVSFTSLDEIANDHSRKTEITLTFILLGSFIMLLYKERAS